MSRKDNACVHVNDAKFSQTTYYDLHILTSFINCIYRTKFLKFQTTIILQNDACISSHVTCDTTGVEGTQCQLSTRLTDRLSSDDADSFTLLHHSAGCKVTSITFSTYTMLSLTSQYGTDLYTFDRRFFDFLCNLLCDFLSGSYQQFSGSRMYDIMYGYTTKDTLVQCCNNLIVILQRCTNQSAQCTTVFLSYDHIV